MEASTAEISEFKRGNKLMGYLNLEALISNKDAIKKIFFLRVCGTGMGACAVLLSKANYHVAGVDITFYPPMSDYLRESKITLYDWKNFSHELINDYDLIVVGNTISKKSEFADFLAKTKIPYTSFPTALGALVLGLKNVVGVAGTHGKTTTTYFLAQMLEKLGETPGYLVGGTIKGKDSSELGNDEDLFVIEADEYDSAFFEKFSKFRQYQLDSMILTSLEFDHGDIFTDLGEIKKQFISVFPRLKALIYCSDYEGARDIMRSEEKYFSPNCYIQEYGIESEVGPKNICYSEKTKETTFSIFLKNQEIKLTTNISGEHNILNLTACFLFCDYQKYAHNNIINSLKKLEMVKRRQEERGYYKNSLILDDFAHHPTALKTTIESLKIKYNHYECLICFEPGSATSRSNVFQEEFARVLSQSEHLILLRPESATTLKNYENLDMAKLKNDILKKNEEIKTLVISSNLEELIVEIDRFCDRKTNQKKLIVFFSNRTCYNLWGSDFVSKIKTNFSSCMH